MAGLKAQEERTGDIQPLLELPPVDAAQHLIGYLFEVGPSIAGEVLTFQEIQAWQNATGTILNSWEATTLRLLSGEYLAERQAAEDPVRLAPYIQDIEQHRKNVAKGLKAVFQQVKQEDVRQGPLPRPKRLQPSPGERA